MSGKSVHVNQHRSGGVLRLTVSAANTPQVRPRRSATPKEAAAAAGASDDPEESGTEKR